MSSTYMAGCYLVIKSHGKEDSVDADGSKDEILKEGAGDKCPNLIQKIIFDKKNFHRRREDGLTPLHRSML